MVEQLDRAALLPAIVFIFSRNGCDAAVRQLLGSGVTLTRPEEQSEIAGVLATTSAGSTRPTCGRWTTRASPRR